MRTAVQSAAESLGDRLVTLGIGLPGDGVKRQVLEAWPSARALTRIVDLRTVLDHRGFHHAGVGHGAPCVDAAVLGKGHTLLFADMHSGAFTSLAGLRMDAGKCQRV